MTKSQYIKGIFLLLSFSLFHFASAQGLSQVFRGRVLEEGSFQAIPEASIQIYDSEDQLISEGQTDAGGKYEFAAIKFGRYLIKVKKKGFVEYVVPDLLVEGKEVVLDFVLTPSVYEGEEVLITGQSEREFDRPSVHLLKVEDSKRIAASFFDPARVAASYSGVVKSDNQSNNLIIRGNSPTGVRWRLEGVDIANPNHLPNAGTFSDRISLSGGGQIILSTQLLANSIFSKGAFSAEYGDALSGVFDMRLRKGNNENREFTLQAGLIGIDLSAEGPISKKQGSSYLVNYRYSFTGLLASLGVTFGGEDIRFQDLAFNLSFPTKKAGDFTIFGMGGRSTNVFTGAREDSNILVGKDRFDIDFLSNMGAIGMTHQINIGNKSFLRTVFSASGISSSRTGQFIDDFLLEPRTVEEDQLSQNFLTLSSAFTHQFSSKILLKTGIFLTQQSSQIESRQGSILGDTLTTLAFNEGSTQLIRPYASLKFAPTARLTFDLGFHAQYLTLNGTFSLEPRINAHLNLTEKHQLSLAYGLHSQQQLPQVYFTRINEGGEISFPNQNLDFTKAHHIVLSYQYRYSDKLNFRIEPYYQQLFNVPVVPDLNRPISTLNLIEGFVNDSLVNEGSGRNYGIEFSMHKYLTNEFYAILSGSLYESKYTAFDGVERDSRFNGNYAVAASLGYERERNTAKGKNKLIGINLRVLQTGGMFLQAVDTAASIEQQRTVFDESQGFVERLDDLFRIDLGINFRHNKAKRSRTLSLDIQNLTNNTPIAFRVFDVVEQTIVERRRFGLVPVLSYRLEF